MASLDTGSDNFYVYLPCDTTRNGNYDGDLTGTVKEKSLSSFVTALNPPIDLNDELYEVALVQLLGETTIENIDENSKVEFIFRRGKYIGTTAEDPNKKIPINWTHTVTIPSGYYSSSLHILNTINLNLKKDGIRLGLKVIDSESERESNSGALRRKGLSHYNLVLDARHKTIKKDDYEWKLSAIIFYGMLRHLFDVESGKYIQELENRTAIWTEKGDYFGVNEFLDPISTTLFLYTNIISHQYVGEESAKLLRTVVLHEGSNKIDIDFNHYHYFPLQGSYHKYIEIDIRNFNGELVRLTPGKIIVKLHFRRIGYRSL